MPTMLFLPAHERPGKFLETRNVGRQFNSTIGGGSWGIDGLAHGL